MNESTLPQKLRNARQALRLSQDEVADYVGSVQATYQNWEAGNNIPKMKYIPKLCEKLKLEMDDFLPPIPHNHLIIS